MKKILIAVIAIAAIVASCEKRYFQPSGITTNVKHRVPDSTRVQRPDRVRPPGTKRRP